MTLRPPRINSRLEDDPLAAALQQEIVNEKAGTLFRLTRKLEKALDRLFALEAQDGANADEQARRFAEAAEALWYVTIQREMCGLRHHREFFDHMNVPRQMRLKMGPTAASQIRSSASSAPSSVKV